MGDFGSLDLSSNLSRNKYFLQFLFSFVFFLFFPEFPLTSFFFFPTFSSEQID